VAQWQWDGWNGCGSAVILSGGKLRFGGSGTGWLGGSGGNHFIEIRKFLI
jgi:hypothetical protein